MLTFQEGDLAEEKPVNEGATGDGGDGHGSQIEEGVSLGVWRRGRSADSHGNQTSHGQDCNLEKVDGVSVTVASIQHPLATPPPLHFSVIQVLTRVII